MCEDGDGEGEGEGGCDKAMSTLCLAIFFMRWESSTCSLKQMVSCTCSITKSDKRNARVENLMVNINLVYNVKVLVLVLVSHTHKWREWRQFM